MGDTMTTGEPNLHEIIEDLQDDKKILWQELKEKDSKIQELQREIDDNRKVIAANGMTIGELRKEVERLEKYIADHFNHVA